MTTDKDQTDPLEPFFDAAREAAPVPSGDLIARVMADAEAAQPVAVPPAPARKSRGAQLLEALGGWPAMGGLATAAATGVWIGISPPLAIEALTSGQLSTGGAVYLIDTSAELALGLTEEAM